MTLELTLRVMPIGATPFGSRLEVPFEGTARSELWDGDREGVMFETASERLAWLNDTVALGKGTPDGDHLQVELFRITT